MKPAVSEQERVVGLRDDDAVAVIHVAGGGGWFVLAVASLRPNDDELKVYRQAIRGRELSFLVGEIVRNDVFAENETRKLWRKFQDAGLLPPDKFSIGRLLGKLRLTIESPAVRRKFRAIALGVLTAADSAHRARNGYASRPTGLEARSTKQPAISAYGCEWRWALLLTRRTKLSGPTAPARSRAAAMSEQDGSPATAKSSALPGSRQSELTPTYLYESTSAAQHHRT